MREERVTCKNCGKPLPKGRWIYCSDYCSRSWRYYNRKSLKICRNCGKKILGRKRIYCSDSCKEKFLYWNPSPQHTKTCPNCGKDISYTSKQKYCSIICNRSYRNRKKNIKENLSYLKFIIEHCKQHAYFSSKTLTYYYMKKYNIPEPNEYSQHSQQAKTEIARTFGGYLKTFGRYESLHNIRQKSGRQKVYKTTEAFLALVHDYMNLKPLHKCKNYRITENTMEKIEWRTLRDMEKNEIINFNGKEYAKMHFLGISKEVDLHFRKLMGEVKIPQKLKGYDILRTLSSEKMIMEEN